MRKSYWITLVALLAIAAGGVTYAITHRMTTLPLVFIWGGILLLLLSFYVNFASVVALLTSRSTKYGANLAIVVSVFVLFLALVGVFSIKYKWRVDLTATGRYTLSPQTIKILGSLDRDVEAVAFYRGDERTRQMMYDLLEEYSYYSTRFKFWFVDPDKKPAVAAKYGVTSYRTTLFISGDNEEMLGFESEEKLTNALLKVIRDEQKAVYFTKGHGESSIEDFQKDGYKGAKDAMEKENYLVKEILLVNSDGVPEDASLLVVAGPEKDLLPSELGMVSEYLDRGGKILFALDPGDLPATSAYLEAYGFTIGGDIIVDNLSQIYGANYLTPVVTDYDGRHPLTSEFNLATFYPIVRSVEVTEDPAQGRFNLALTSPSSWAVIDMKSLGGDRVAFNPKTDRKGPLSVAAVTAIEVEVDGAPEAGDELTSESPETPPKDKELRKWGKILVIGDSDFANNTHINLAGNRDFFLNIIGWLNEETDLISIRQRSSELSPLTLTMTQSRFVFWLSVIIMPSLVAIVGVAVLMRRRSGG